MFAVPWNWPAALRGAAQSLLRHSRLVARPTSDVAPVVPPSTPAQRVRDVTPTATRSRKRRPSRGELLARRLPALLRARRPQRLILIRRSEPPLRLDAPSELSLEFRAASVLLSDRTGQYEMDFEELLAVELCG